MGGVDLRWDLLTDASRNFGNQLVSAAGQIHERRDRSRNRRAATDYLAHPDDPETFNALFERSPELAMSLRSDHRQEVARNAYSNYLLAGRRGAVPGAPTPPAPLGDTAPSIPPLSVGSTGGNPAPAAPLATLQPGNALNSATAPTDETFAAFARADPAAASRARQEEATMSRQRAAEIRDHVRGLTDLNNYAMQIIGGVRDQASYDAARAAMHRQMVAAGYDPSGIDSLPPTYSPETIQQLRNQGMDTHRQLEAARQDRRLNWDIEDDQTDNAEVHRYHDAEIGTAQRGQNLTDARGRRGQDIEHGDRLRGQDLGHGDRVRGQDLTNARAGRRRAGRASSGEGTVIVNPTTGQRMRLQGGQWVPAG